MGGGQSAPKRTLLHRIRGGDETGFAAALKNATHVEVNAVVNTMEGLYPIGYTPLLAAARDGHEAMCLQLLARGADMHVRFPEGAQESLLTCAARQGLDLLCEALLEAGVSAGLDDDAALFAAASHGQCELCVNLVKRGANVNARDMDTADTVLMRAAEHGDGWTCGALLRMGANIGTQNRRGETAFHFAARAGCASVCLDLVNVGAWINAPDRRGITPLMQTAADAKLYMCKELIKMGAGVSTADRKGNTVLIHAARHNKADTVSVVQLLIDRGANANAKNAKGENALWHAAKGGNEALCRILLKSGCDPYAPAVSGASAADVAGQTLRRVIIDTHWRMTGRAKKNSNGGADSTTATTANAHLTGGGGHRDSGASVARPDSYQTLADLTKTYSSASLKSAVSRSSSGSAGAEPSSALTAPDPRRPLSRPKLRSLAYSEEGCVI